MEHNQHTLSVDLIDSTFKKDDAFEVIMALLDHKIKFHQHLRLSAIERGGAEEQQSALRIQELRKVKQKVKEYFSQLPESERLSVHGAVTMACIGENRSKQTA